MRHVDPDLLKQALELDPAQNPWPSKVAQTLCGARQYDQYADLFGLVADQAITRATWARLQQCYGTRQNYTRLTEAQAHLDQARVLIGLVEPGAVRDELEAGALRQGVVLYHVNGNYLEAAACYRRQAQMYETIAAKTQDQQAAAQLNLQAEVAYFAAVVEDLDDVLVRGQNDIIAETFLRLEKASEWLDPQLDGSAIGANYRLSLEAFCGVKHPTLTGLHRPDLMKYTTQLAARDANGQLDFRHWILLAQAQSALNTGNNSQAIALATQVARENAYGDSTSTAHLFLARLFVAQGDNAKALAELEKLATMPDPGTHSAKAAGLRLQAQINLAR